MNRKNRMTVEYRHAAAVLSHPDFTVGFGIAPNQSAKWKNTQPSRGLLPPVRNCTSP